MVVVKPAGQIVHPAGDYASNSLANVVQHHLDQQTHWRGLLRPGIVHRLDRLTSGVIIVSKEHCSHALLTEAFMLRKVHKTYVALVTGVIEPDQGVLDKPIGGIDDRDSCLMRAGADAFDARSARTEFKVIERFADHTLVEAKPVTGRHHQIRVHFADIGHPVVDDEFYGSFGWIKQLQDGTLLPEPLGWRSGESEKRRGEGGRGKAEDEESETLLLSDELMLSGEMLVGRHALHAHRIQFRHPITWEPLCCEAPLPPDIAKAVEQLRAAKM